MKDISSEILKKQTEEHIAICNGFFNYYSLTRQDHVYDAELIMQLGNSKLYHFGGVGDPVVIIPSLINKAYILDLKNASFAKTLCDKHSVYLIDWDEPRDEEVEFYTADYIELRIKPFIDLVIRKHNILPNILGYCMGGILCLLYASRYKDDIKKVITIGMPYNFDSLSFIKTDLKVLRMLLGEEDSVNPEILKAIFYLNNFAAVHKKYCDFSSGISDQIAEIESWVNDGVHVSKNLLLECVDLLINKNSMFLYKGFKSRDVEYDLTQIDKAVIAVAGRYDSIVDLKSASDIDTLSENITVISYDTGHVGQILKYAENIKDLL